MTMMAIKKVVSAKLKHQSRVSTKYCIINSIFNIYVVLDIFANINAFVYAV